MWLSQGRNNLRPLVTSTGEKEEAQQLAATLYFILLKLYLTFLKGLNIKKIHRHE